MSVVHVTKGDMLQALIIRPRSGPGAKPESGLRFYTDPGEQIQVACMVHPAGHEIKLHSHREIYRSIYGTPEVLFVRRGRINVILDTDDGYRVYSLVADDVLILFRGVHGFKVLEDCEMWEVKQGPYADNEKEFPPAKLWEGGPVV